MAALLKQARPVLTRLSWVSTRGFAVSAGSDIVSAAPDVKLQKARTWDEGVSSQFSTTPLSELFRGKKVVIFGLPGAFTGVCSAQHVPSYLKNAEKFKQKGVDSIICVAVNDPYVMNGWAEKLQAKEAFGFDRADRKRLSITAGELPTIFEVVSGAAKKQAKEKSTATINGSSKSKSTGKVQQPPEPRANLSKSVATRDEDDTLDEEDDEEHGDTLCGACGEHYSHDEFWIGCDICEKWFHGKCVKITPARAEHIKQYKCPSCTNKRPRP